MLLYGGVEVTLRGARCSCAAREEFLRHLAVFYLLQTLLSGQLLAEVGDSTVVAVAPCQHVLLLELQLVGATKFWLASMVRFLSIEPCRRHEHGLLVCSSQWA